MMREGGGRGRDRHGWEYSPRSEERGGRVGLERISAPPSRRLWIGNLSIHMTQALLYDTFARFGDIDNIIFIQGRSYAFVNYSNEEDAIVASRMLQGFVVSGLPLRVEFQKGVSCVNLYQFSLCFSSYSKYSHCSSISLVNQRVKIL